MTLCGVQGPCSTGLNAARALTAWEPTAGSDAAPGGRRRLEDGAALSQLGLRGQVESSGGEGAVRSWRRKRTSHSTRAEPRAGARGGLVSAGSLPPAVVGSRSLG